MAIDVEMPSTVSEQRLAQMGFESPYRPEARSRRSMLRGSFRNGWATRRGPCGAVRGLAGKRHTHRRLGDISTRNMGLRKVQSAQMGVSYSKAREEMTQWFIARAVQRRHNLRSNPSRTGSSAECARRLSGSVHQLSKRNAMGTTPVAAVSYEFPCGLFRCQRVVSFVVIIDGITILFDEANQDNPHLDSERDTFVYPV